MPLIKTDKFVSPVMHKKFGLLLMLVLLFPFINTAQQRKRDSLKMVLEQLKASLEHNIRDTSYVNTLNEFSEAIRFHNRDSLLLLSKEALEHSKDIEYKEGEIRSYIGIGDYYSDGGFHDNGILNYRTALEAAEVTENDNLILQIENKLAGEYEYKGDFALALQEMLKGVEIATKLNDVKMLSIFNENIGLLYAEQQDYKEAIEYLEVSKKFNKEIQDELFSAYTYANMGSVYADSHKYEYAMFNVNKSIPILEKHAVLDWLAFAYSTKGKVYLRQKRYKWALYWYRQSQMLHDKSVDDDRSEIHLLQGLAETQLGLKNKDKALGYAEKALDISTKLKSKKGIKYASETLYKISKLNKNFGAALTYHELFQKLSDTIAKNENKKSLLMLKTKLGHEKQKEDLITENEKALAKQKNYVTAIMGILLVLTVIIFLIKRSEKIQKNLNKELSLKKTKLEKSEIELREINDTKDKLFSIIGHDLRGPIGAFQGLLQLFRKGEVDQNEFLSFIPKLRADIDHISFTLNNLLSWGQTQMNGSVTKPSRIALENLVAENINLLSEIAHKKSIKLVSQVPENTLAWSDGDQVDIVIRNLISNALKFTPENGLVTIGIQEKGEFWEVYVKDTGVGMDNQTKEKIFAKNENVTTYGTHNEKGTGLGLMLCKEMVENNKGTIWVESTLNKGTCFYFTLPMAKEEYEKAS